MPGKLYLIPSPISNGDIAWTLPVALQQQISELTIFIAEHPKTARQFLKQLNYRHPLQTITIMTLNEHTQQKDLKSLIEPLLSEQDIGLMSEAGCPVIADPGAEFIRLAHYHGITVVPLVGPSSILLALMASGLNGQCFAFHGYLPVDTDMCSKKIIDMEKTSLRMQQTQIFIETPYRNLKLFAQLVKNCHDSTLLCIASQLTALDESIATQTIKAWRTTSPNIDKLPTIFLLQAQMK